IFNTHDQILRGESRLQDLITGFIDPNEQIADPSARAAEEVAEESDPEPEDVAARLKKLRRLHKKYFETLTAEGTKQPPTKKTLKGLLNEFMELKLAP